MTNARAATPHGPRFTQLDVDSLLDVLKAHLPLCKDEWDYVMRKHNNAFRTNNCNINSIRQNSASLHRKEMPTGDPSMPSDVRRAKQILYLMTDRVNFGDGEEADAIASEAFAASSDENRAFGDFNFDM